MEPIQQESSTPNPQQDDQTFKDLAKGCIFGAFIGDALGSYLEFKTKVTPQEVEEGMKMPGGGPFDLVPGQVTDDSEMAQSLIHGLIRANGKLNLDFIAQEYGEWFESGPFDIGITTRNAVKPAAVAASNWARAARQGAMKSLESQSNGSLMRINPLAVWGSKLKRSDLVVAAWEEARLTHPNRVALNASILYVYVIQYLLHNKGDSKGAYEKCQELLLELDDDEITKWMQELGRGELPPANKLIGWLKIAFLHALYYLAQHAQYINTKDERYIHDYKSALKDLLAKAGDTDTNLAIVGGVLGALYGFEALPKEYVKELLNVENKLRPEKWVPGYHLEASIDKLIEIRPTALEMEGSESSEYKNVPSWKGPPKVFEESS